MDAKDNGVRSVERALNILDCFTPQETDLSLTEIAKKIGLSPSTAFRLLDTLEQRHYVHRDPKSLRYTLGFRLAQLSNLAFESMDLNALAQQELALFNKEFDESVGIYTLKEDYRVCTARIESSRLMRSVFTLGTIRPLTRGASGRAILAHLPEETIDRLLQQDAPNPFTSKEKLAEVRSRGVAVSLGEHETGLVSISAPLFNARGEVIGSLFVSAPSVRADYSVIERMCEATRRHAASISQLLGYIP